jgi:hypothetical protein
MPDGNPRKLRAQKAEPDGRQVKIIWKKDGNYSGNQQKPIAD